MTKPPVARCDTQITRQYYSCYHGYGIFYFIECWISFRFSRILPFCLWNLFGSFVIRLLLCLIDKHVSFIGNFVLRHIWKISRRKQWNKISFLSSRLLVACGDGYARLFRVQAWKTAKKKKVKKIYWAFHFPYFSWLTRLYVHVLLVSEYFPFIAFVKIVLNL